MICPMTFSNPETFHHGAMECDLDCAWAFLLNGNLSCALAVHMVGVGGANFRPLDYENERGE